MTIFDGSIGRKKRLIMLSAVLIALVFIFLMLRPDKQAQLEDKLCDKLNALIDENVPVEIYGEDGEKIELNPAVFFRKTVFAAAEDDNLPGEIYSGEIKINKDCRISHIVNLKDLSNTPDGEEGVFTVSGGRVAFGTHVRGKYQSVTVISVSGKDKKTFVFKKPVKQVSLDLKNAPGKEARALKVSYIDGDAKKNLELDLVSLKTDPGTDGFTLQKEIKGTESFITSSVNFGRGILGKGIVGKAEEIFFSVNDWLDGFFYGIGRFFTGKKSATVSRLAGGGLKNIEPLIKKGKKEELEKEGVWVLDGMPASEDSKNPVMAHTFLRPDPEKPYALVELLYVDPEQAEIIPVCGTKHPQSTTGISGKGVIPEDPEVRKKLLCAFNGGFQALHGEYGMMVDGDIILPPKKEIATLCFYERGIPRLGIWEKDIFETSSLVSLRQNLPPLIYNGKFNEENKFWGYSPKKANTTYVWRSGLGITRNKKFIFAIGNSLTARTLAAALLACGAEKAMHLDMNVLNVACEIYGVSADKDGKLSVKADKLTDRSFGASGIYLKPHTRDFFYIVRKK